MTLNTYIYIQGPIDGEDLHRWVCENLFQVPDYSKVRRSRKVKGQTYLDWRNEPYTADLDEMNNEPSQGLPAWLFLSWSDTPMDKDEGEPYEPEGEYYALLSFDTAYSYHDPETGFGCTELHASYIIRLYDEYLKPRGIDLIWQDEYTGKLYKNLDPEGLQDFLGGGEAATDWFNNTLLPNLPKIIESVKDDLTED